MSHDLRTPLATIKANLQLVQRRMKREQALDSNWLSERLESIERSTTKMAGMIEDLLDLGRLQMRQLSDSGFRPFDLLPLIRQAVTEQQAASKRHQLILKIGVETLPMSGNAPRLDRMLTNLLGNAVKYSPQGGEITIEVTQEDQAWAHLSIQDQGIGIPASDLPHIFEPFHRASNVTDHIQGTGVGLASVAQIIEQHQGTISVTSEEQRGSCFTVRLPLVNGAQQNEADRKGTTMKEQQQGEVAKQSGANECILVVDDDLNLCQTIQLVLEEEGFTVETALDGVEALEQVEQVHPTMVVLDGSAIA